jgi:transposase
MSYRTVKIDWLPKSKHDWDTFTDVRADAANLWSWLVERHASARQTGETWPSRDDLQKETKKQYPNLHSQSIQMTVHDFLEAIASAEALRRKGIEFEYPHKKMKYRQVIFNGQAAVVRSGKLILPCGKAGKLKIRIPDNIEFPGRIMEVRLNCGDFHVVCLVPEEKKPVGSTIGIDLGVNTLIAATDGDKAILVSGREMKATIQNRNKRLAEIRSKQSFKTKGSRRHKRGVVLFLLVVGHQLRCLESAMAVLI